MNRSPRKKTNKDKIMEAAYTIFAQKGFKETSVSEISKAAGVSDSTVYENFGNKEGLLFAISEKVTKFAVDSINAILPFIKGSENRLRAIIQAYLTGYQENPYYTAVCMLELKTNRRFHLTESYKSVKELTGMLLTAIKEGIDDGVFRQDIDPYLMRAMILGTIEHLCIRRHLLGEPADLLSYTDPLLDMVLTGAKVRSKTPMLNISLQIGDEKIEVKDTCYDSEDK